MQTDSSSPALAESEISLAPIASGVRPTSTASRRTTAVTVAAVLAAVFVAEMAIMFMLSWRKGSLLEHIGEAMVDSTLLTAVLVPVFYALILKPMRRECAERQRAERDVRYAYDQLEGIVRARTTELALTNESLRAEIARREHAEQVIVQNYDRMRGVLEGTIEAMALTFESRDPYTAGHQRRVAKLVVAIANELALPPDQVEAVRIAAIIHDIGKIAVPAEILSKPGKLRDAEFRLIQEHPEVAYEILRSIDFPWRIADIVRQHHERLNGSGYPFGLKGDEILLEARILAVADVVEAMVSHRPYRPGLGIERALAEIERGSGSAYDSRVVSACILAVTAPTFAWE